MLKELNWGSILLAVAYIAGGVLLCMFPELSGSVICYMLGIAAGVFGVINLFTYFSADIRDSLDRSDLVIGLMSLLAGGLIIVKQDIVIEIVPILLGLLIMFIGFTMLHKAIVAIRIHYNKWWIMMLLSVLIIVAGNLIIFWFVGQYPHQILYKWIGGGLIGCGVSDLFVTLFLTNKFYKYFNEYENAPQISSDQIVDAEIIHPQQPQEEPVQPEPVNAEPVMAETMTEDIVQPEIVSEEAVPQEIVPETPEVIPDEMVNAESTEGTDAGKEEPSV